MSTLAMPWRRALVAVVATGLAAAALAAQAATPSTSFTLGGAVAAPTRYDLAALQALPPITQTVSFQTGGGSQTHTFVGASLWGTLQSAGMLTDPAVKNDLLNRVVQVTGSDGYRAVYALGEISPEFGARQALLAWGEVVGGVTQPLGSDGFARSTAPGDVKGGRYVSSLVDVDLQRTSSTARGSGGGVSTRFAVSGAVDRVASFDLAALQALPETAVTVGNDTWTGVSLWDLLSGAVGLQTDPAVKNDVLGMYVVATGSDGYKAAFSLGELNPAFGNQADLVAFELNGAPLTDSGFARIVAAGDGKKGRWVSNLTSLEVFHAAVVPEPAHWALMAGGLLLLGLHGRRAAALRGAGRVE